MCGAKLLPSLSLLPPPVRIARGEVNAGFDANGRRITTCFARRTAHTIQGVLPRLVGRELREPTIGQAADALDHGLGSPAQPDGNGTLHGEGVESCVSDLVPASLEVHDFLSPQGAHNRNLFL